MPRPSKLASYKAVLSACTSSRAQGPLAVALRLLGTLRDLRGGSYFPPLTRAKITLPATGSSGYLSSITRGIFCNRNLTDEAHVFSEDVEFDSKNYTLIAHLEDPPKFIYKNNRSELIVTITLPKNASLEDPEHVQDALLKLYSRVKYYASL